ncbi:MAG: LacI family DNA-binding transcriptional regulator [Lachnospiraceae bacterium]|nr:LacI family DNA-binding transcriptional regulator [Lachnospiraceae bacterium]
MENKKVTIDDIARELNVSKTTVSRAISGKGRISTATRERVMEYIQAANYKPNVIAKGLAKSKTYNIGFVMPGDYSLVDLPFFQECMLGVSEIASSYDYDVLISMVTENDMGQLKRLVENHKVDGVILTRTLVKDGPAEYLEANQVPFVTIGTSLNKEIVQIDNDHRSACRELTSILLMRGIRKLALIGGNKTHVVTQKRLQGFQDAFLEQGLSPDNSLIYMDVEHNVMIEKVVEEMVERQVECVICMDDSICTHVLNKLRKEKIRVPGDIKVASFYNSSLLESNIPSITSLNFDVKELGMITCRTLLDRMEGKTVQRRTLLGYEVSMKESTQNVL